MARQPQLPHWDVRANQNTLSHISSPTHPHLHTLTRTLSPTHPQPHPHLHGGRPPPRCPLEGVQCKSRILRDDE